MSNSPEYSDFAGRKSGKTPDRSNFSQTCNLLSQFLKDKGRFGDLSFGMAGKTETKGRPESFRSPTMTIDLLNKDKSSDVSDQNGVGSAIDFYPQFAGFGSYASVDEAMNRADLRKSATATTETETTDQMTIFYAGQVLVFNDLPADKAREVMLLASKGSSQNTSSNFLSGSGPDKINSGIPTAPIPTIPAAASSAGNSQGLNSGGTYSIPASPAAAAAAPNPQAPLGSDLPIARRNSLHRFLEKRKDRVSSKAPYQVNNASRASPKPAEDDKLPNLSSSEEGQSSKQLDLRL